MKNRKRAQLNAQRRRDNGKHRCPCGADVGESATRPRRYCSARCRYRFRPQRESIRALRRCSECGGVLGKWRKMTCGDLCARKRASRTRRRMYGPRQTARANW